MLSTGLGRSQGDATLLAGETEESQPCTKHSHEVNAMTIECYYHQCPKHSNQDKSGEGPFCYEQECSASFKEIQLYEAGRKLELMGYNLEELDQDNPYN